MLIVFASSSVSSGRVHVLASFRALVLEHLGLRVGGGVAGHVELHADLVELQRGEPAGDRGARRAVQHVDVLLERVAGRDRDRVPEVVAVVALVVVAHPGVLADDGRRLVDAIGVDLRGDEGRAVAERPRVEDRRQLPQHADLLARARCVPGCRARSGRGARRARHTGEARAGSPTAPRSAARGRPHSGRRSPSSARRIRKVRRGGEHRLHHRTAPSGTRSRPASRPRTLAGSAVRPASAVSRPGRSTVSTAVGGLRRAGAGRAGSGWPSDDVRAPAAPSAGAAAPPRPCPATRAPGRCRRSR